MNNKDFKLLSSGTPVVTKILEVKPEDYVSSIHTLLKDEGILNKRSWVSLNITSYVKKGTRPRAKIHTVVNSSAEKAWDALSQILGGEPSSIRIDSTSNLHSSNCMVTETRSYYILVV